MNRTKIIKLLENISEDFQELVNELRYGPSEEPKPVEKTVSISAPETIVKSQEPIELPLLQSVGKELIQNGKQDQLKSYLVSRGLKNLSSAPESDYETIYHALLALSNSN